MQSVFEVIMSWRRDGDGRRVAKALAVAIAIFVAALVFTAIGQAADAKKPGKPKPKVKATLSKGQLNVLGTPGNDRITVRLQPGNKSRLQVASAGRIITCRRSRFSGSVVHAGAGSDALAADESNGVFTAAEQTSLFGDAGNDLAVAKGSAAAETFELSRDGSFLRYAQNGRALRVGAERFDLRPLGGVDTITVNASSGNDTVSIAPSAGAVDVGGVGSAISIRGPEQQDVLNVNGLGGNDAINGAVGLAALIKVGTIDGGAGNDSINGGDGSESLVGGDGNDAIDGNRGDDTGLLGSGDDSFRWDPGDGSDKVE